MVPLSRGSSAVSTEFSRQLRGDVHISSRKSWNNFQAPIRVWDVLYDATSIGLEWITTTTSTWRVWKSRLEPWLESKLFRNCKWGDNLTRLRNGLDSSSAREKKLNVYGINYSVGVIYTGENKTVMTQTVLFRATGPAQARSIDLLARDANQFRNHLWSLWKGVIFVQTLRLGWVQFICDWIAPRNVNRRRMNRPEASSERAPALNRHGVDLSPGAIGEANHWATYLCGSVEELFGQLKFS